MNSSILHTPPSCSRHGFAQDFVKSLTSSFPALIVCTHFWSISQKANLITAEQVDYVVVQLPVAPKTPVLGKRLCPFGEDVFLAMSPHTASQKQLNIKFDWRPLSFPGSSQSLSPLQGLQRDKFPKTRAAENNPDWEFHFMASSTSILSLVFANEAANGANWSIGPAFVELRALTQTSKDWKFQRTPADRKGHLFQFWCSFSITLKLNHRKTSKCLTG